MKFIETFKSDIHSFNLCHPQPGLMKYFYYPGLRTVLIFRLSQYLFQYRWMRPFAYALTVLNDLIAGVWIGPRVDIGPGLVLAHARGLVVNPTARIGKNCQILQRVTIGGPNVTIGDNVAIYSSASIISNIRGAGSLRIGSHCIIGAGSVVTKNIPDCSIVVGVPGRVVKKISDEENWQGFIKANRLASRLETGE